MASREFDVIVYGASGFTGKYVVEEVYKKSISAGYDFTWAVSGRSKRKIELVLQEVSKWVDKDLTNVTIFEADVGDQEALERVAEKCSVLISCVGPYRFFGEPVVQACVSQGTNYVDVCGEPQFLEEMQVKYHEAAKQKGIYIVGSCGMDSIPTDLGVVFMQQKFGGDMNAVEMYMEFEKHGKPILHPLNYATYQSAIYGFANAKDLRAVRKELFPEQMPKPKYSLKPKSSLHFSKIVNGWCLPFLFADRSVVKRTQYHLYTQEKKRPCQLNAYFKVPSFVSSVLAIFTGLVFGVLAMFKVGRYILETFPRLISFGLVSHEPPPREEMKPINLKVTLVGEGWTEKLAEPTDQHSEPPNKKMTVTVNASDPGYGATSIMVVESALTILNHRNKLPENGGVFTPGAAFHKTNIVHNLSASGVSFVVEKDIPKDN